MTGSSIGMSTTTAATDAVVAMNPRTETTADIRWEPMARDHERAYWRGLMSANRPDHLSRAVLDRLRLRPEGPLLAIHEDVQDDIEGHFRRIARDRLRRLPMSRRSFDLALGHPVDLARLAFERHDPLPAAAMYALSHDDLLPVRHDRSSAEWSSVRFALARCLARLAGDAQDCVALAEAALEHLEQGQAATAQPDLCETIRAWLDEQKA